jgi:hypothetical protein
VETADGVLSERKQGTICHVGPALPAPTTRSGAATIGKLIGADRHTRQADRQADRHTRQADRYARQADRQADRHTRQADRHTRATMG